MTPLWRPGKGGGRQEPRPKLVRYPARASRPPERRHAAALQIFGNFANFAHGSDGWISKPGRGDGEGKGEALRWMARSAAA